MAKMHVKQGSVRALTAEEAKVNAGKPMRWATREQSGMAVSICDLSRKEKGFACKCVCPACGSALQAVNAGVDREHFLRANTLGQFFRHESGQQRDNCLVVIARIAALQLLIERREIDLPPPTRRAFVAGISGHLYHGEATASRRRMHFREHTWIDSQLASITLEDGHIVLLRLDTQRTVKNEGDYDAIITITVDNPDVASWDMAEILAKMKIGDQVQSCWDKHWDDDDLNAMATQDAESEAAKYIDLLPSVLGSLDGLTQAQKSESLLHHVIKSILLKAHSMASPSYTKPLYRHMADGETVTREIRLSLGELSMSGASQEHPIGGFVADVYCRAHTPHADPFDLIIEVAVTHRVDDYKQKKIEAVDIACLEIDVRDFRQRGRVTVDDLATEVLRNPENKRWVHHPLIAAKLAEESRALDEMDKTRKDAVASEHRTRKWLASLTQEQLLRIYFQALVHYWQWGHSGVVSGYRIELPDLARRLVCMGLTGADESPIVEKGGVLHLLHLAKIYSYSPVPASVSLGKMCNALAHSRHYRSLITYCLVGMRVYQPVVPGAQENELKAIRSHVVTSLQAGESEFARLRKFDALVAACFPALAPSLAAAFGTEDHARALQLEKRKRESARIEKERASRAALEAAMKREQDRRAVTQAIFDASKSGWAPKLGLASDVEQILAHQAMKRAAKRFMLDGLDAREVLTSAWTAREEGITLYDWFRLKYYDQPDDVNKLSELLRIAWMV